VGADALGRQEQGRLRFLPESTLREEIGMNALPFGLACGVGFGALAVLLMLPMKFPDRRTALAAAFASRFAIGLLIPVTHLPLPAWLAGAVVGLLVSLPDAIVTRAYAPILGVGIVGGACIGLLSGIYVD
jgi:hypothetical protein